MASMRERQAFSKTSPGKSRLHFCVLTVLSGYCTAKAMRPGTFALRVRNSLMVSLMQNQLCRRPLRNEVHANDDRMFALDLRHDARARTEHLEPLKIAEPEPNTELP